MVWSRCVCVCRKKKVTARRDVKRRLQDPGCVCALRALSFSTMAHGRNACWLTSRGYGRQMARAVPLRLAVGGKTERRDGERARRKKQESWAARMRSEICDVRRGLRIALAFASPRGEERVHFFSIPCFSGSEHRAKERERERQIERERERSHSRRANAISDASLKKARHRVHRRI